MDVSLRSAGNVLMFGICLMLYFLNVSPPKCVYNYIYISYLPDVLKFLKFLKFLKSGKYKKIRKIVLILIEGS